MRFHKDCNNELIKENIIQLIKHNSYHNILVGCQLAMYSGTSDACYVIRRPYTNRLATTS